MSKNRPTTSEVIEEIKSLSDDEKKAFDAVVSFLSFQVAAHSVYAHGGWRDETILASVLLDALRRDLRPKLKRGKGSS